MGKQLAVVKSTETFHVCNKTQPGEDPGFFKGEGGEKEKWDLGVG